MNKPMPRLIIITAAIGLWLIGFQAFAYSPKVIYQKTGPGVVFILSSEGSKNGSVGTGSIIRKDGLVITNAHVFAKPKSSQLKPDISIFLKPQRVSGNHKKDLKNRYKGKMLAYDLRLDLALLKITNVDFSLPTVGFAESKNVAIGDQVYAIGHPEQGGLWSLTTGVISAYRMDFGGVSGKHLFQTDASINRGNSGGPLLDENGVMVGINSMIARKAADGLTITDVNYSIMSSVALNWLNSLGYRFSVARAVASKVDSPVKPVIPEPEKAAPTVEKPVKTEPPPAKPTKEVVEQPVKPEKTVEEPVKPEKKLETTEVKPPEKNVTPKPGQVKILTKKRPYRMSQLLRDMQEMEDMMDDMRSRIIDYKKKKK